VQYKNILIVLFLVVLAGCSSQTEKIAASQSSSEITILPGEEIFVSAELVNGKIENVARAPKNANPSQTIVFKFEKSDTDMMLSVKNPFPVPIKYHINMIDAKGNPHQTSSCPAIAKGGAFENWPHHIPQLSISNIHVIEGGNFNCVY